MELEPARPNPETGFLEPHNHWMVKFPFDSDKKVLFLELAREAVENRQYPAVHKICDAVNVSSYTFYQHLKRDLKFKAAWNEVRARCKSMLTNELSLKAASKMGTLANIAMLRWLESGTWTNQDRGPGYSNPDEQSHLKQITSQMGEIIDAEVLDNE